jgi:hypothetical protein
MTDDLGGRQEVSKQEAEAALIYLETRPMKMGDIQRALGVKSPTTIKKWIKAGRFPNAALVNGQWRVPPDEVYLMRDAGRHAAELALMIGPQPTEGYEGDPVKDFM